MTRARQEASKKHAYAYYQKCEDSRFAAASFIRAIRRAIGFWEMVMILSNRSL